MISDSTHSKLADHFGSRALMNDATLEDYSHDHTEVLAARPDIVILAESVEDVQYVVRFANEHGVAVTPVSGRMNGWGLHIPYRGGVVLDLSRMDKIRTIDEDKRFCIIEPGVTFGTLFGQLEQRGLYLPIPRAPASRASVIGNLLIHGIGHMPHKTGFQSDLVTGLEVVLGGGECVKLGSASLTKSWICRPPLPDLCGLVLGWCGATGIVTKAGISIFKKPDYVDVACFAVKGRFDRSLFELLMRLLDLDMIDELAGYSWGHHYVNSELCNSERRGAEPDMFFYLRLSSFTKPMIDCKVNAVTDLVKAEHHRNKAIELVDLSKQQKESYLALPVQESQVERMHKAMVSGSTNPTAIMPMVNVIDMLPRIEEALQRYGLPVRFFMNAFKGSRLCSFMVNVLFNKGDERIPLLLREIVEIYLQSDGLIWKAPPWVWTLQEGQMDKGALQTLARVKQLLDPRGIMHPGQFNLR